jgi:hypothetical protein
MDVFFMVMAESVVGANVDCKLTDSFFAEAIVDH